MHFKQYENGSCEWMFSDQEIETLKRNKKFTLSASDLKKISNDLMAVITKFHYSFAKEIQKEKSDGGPIDLSNK